MESVNLPEQIDLDLVAGSLRRMRDFLFAGSPFQTIVYRITEG